MTTMLMKRVRTVMAIVMVMMTWGAAVPPALSSPWNLVVGLGIRAVCMRKRQLSSVCGKEST